jgi:hypothetical protein
VVFDSDMTPQKKQKSPFFAANGQAFGFIILVSQRR